MGIRFRTLAAISLLLSSAELFAQREDQVFVAKNAPTRGNIAAEIGMTRDKVTVDTSVNARPIDVNEITRITFRDEPSDLNAGRMQVIQKNYNQALIDFKKIDVQKIERAYIRQDLEFYKALCLCKLALSDGGDKKAASAAMYAFVSKAPQSYHFYEAAELLGDVAMASGNYADAAKYYGPSGLGAAPWADYQIRANNASGRALIGEKQFDQALEKFQAVVGSDLSTPEAVRQKNLAQAGRAVCLSETAKIDEAISLIQDTINKNDQQDSVLFARLYNALGGCYLKQNKPKEAVMAFLHTDMLFHADADAHAEALYYLSKLWPEVNKSDRAIAARNTLRERYAGSVWASRE
ncbi:MAG TPA: tetratricopeptide repeat protein [Pirellulaceae bacterium]|jgi:tetratricopeptide (TPR) repeat protein